MATVATPPARTPSRGLLLAAFGLLVAFLVTHFLTMQQLRAARVESEALVSNMFSSIELVSNMSRDIDRVRLLADAHLFERDPATMTQVEADIAALQADYAATARAYEPIATLPSEAATWQKVKDDVTSLQQPLDQALALSRENRVAEARQALLSLDPRFEVIAGDMGVLRQINRQAADQALVNVSALQRSSATLTTLRTLVGIGLSLAVGALVARRLLGREAEALRERVALQVSNQELEAFAGRVAHDLREPLTTVAIASSRISQAVPEQMVMTDLLQRSVNRMEVIIEDLLALSRLGVRVQEGVSDPALTVAQIREDLTRLPSEDPVTLRVDVEPAHLRCAEGLLRQVLWNLADNAIKYHRSGVPSEVEIRGRIVGREYELTVRDNGEGMSPDDARQAFEPFFRSGRTRSKPGTGLGLTIVKRVIDVSGGRVSIASQLGQGTTFVMRFPLVGVVPAKAGSEPFFRTPAVR